MPDSMFSPGKGKPIGGPRNEKLIPGCMCKPNLADETQRVWGLIVENLICFLKKK